MADQNVNAQPETPDAPAEVQASVTEQDAQHPAADNSVEKVHDEHTTEAQQAAQSAEKSPHQDELKAAVEAIAATGGVDSTGAKAELNAENPDYEGILKFYRDQVPGRLGQKASETLSELGL